MLVAAQCTRSPVKRPRPFQNSQTGYHWTMVVDAFLMRAADDAVGRGDGQHAVPRHELQHLLGMAVAASRRCSITEGGNVC